MNENKESSGGGGRGGGEIHRWPQPQGRCFVCVSFPVSLSVSYSINVNQISTASLITTDRGQRSLGPILETGFTERKWVYWVLLGFTWFYGVLLGFTEPKWVLLGFTELEWVLLGFTGFYGVLLGFTELEWVLLVFFYWVSLFFLPDFAFGCNNGL